MKFVMCGVVCAVVSGAALGDSNVSMTDKFSWQENTGWMNWRDANGTISGVEILSDHLRGFIWCENIGWVNAGNGGGPYAPGGSQTGADFGINVDPESGELSGFAWGENVGWINFSTSGLGADAARYDFDDRRFYGYAWGENIGWVNLDDSVHFVGGSCPGDLNNDGAVDSSDLAILLAGWGGAGSADLNGNGSVESGDLAILLAAWGVCT